MQNRSRHRIARNKKATKTTATETSEAQKHLKRKPNSKKKHPIQGVGSHPAKMHFKNIKKALAENAVLVQKG